MKKLIFVLFTFVALFVSTNTFAATEDQMAVVFADKLIEKAINKGEEQIVYMTKMKKVLIVAKENKKNSLKTRKMMEALFIEFDNRIKQYEALNPIENNNQVVENNNIQTQEVSIETKRQEMLKLINEYRVSNWLNKLSYNWSLNTASQKYAEKMAINGYISHEEQDWTRSFDRATQEWYNVGIIAENIADTNWNLEYVFNAWKNSKWHNENLLKNGVNDLWLWNKNWVWVLLVWAEWTY